MTAADASRVEEVISRCERTVTLYRDSVSQEVELAREGLDGCMQSIRQNASLSLGMSEAKLTRAATVIADDADFHLLRAYFHASPSLWAVIMAIVKFISTVLSVINIINELTVIITGETLIYWLDKLLPGFQDAWNYVMNRISEFSSMLGWGVDGVLHVLNAVNATGTIVGGITGKSISLCKLEAFDRIKNVATTMSEWLDELQKNPGEFINNQFMSYATYDSYTASNVVKGITDGLKKVTDDVDYYGKLAGYAVDEIYSLHNNMPEFVARNIPAAIWDGIARADAMINDRLLPRLDTLQNKIEEIDALIDHYSKTTHEIAERLARPGDLLSRIAELPDYVRRDQEDKLDTAVSGALGRKVAETYESERIDLSQFSRTYEAMKAPVPSPSFLTLEAPERKALTGITVEPRETWMVGDY